MKQEMARTGTVHGQRGLMLVGPAGSQSQTARTWIGFTGALYMRQDAIEHVAERVEKRKDSRKKYCKKGRKEEATLSKPAVGSGNLKAS